MESTGAPLQAKTEITFTKAISIEECQAALKLCLDCFYPDGYSDRQNRYWAFKWFEDPSFQVGRVVLAKIVHPSGEVEIIGGLRTKAINIYRAGEKYICLGITEIYASPSGRGLNIGQKLIAFCTEVAVIEKFDLILGVARKKIDGFYLPQHFYGVGSFPCVKFKHIKLSRKYQKYHPETTYTFRETEFILKFLNFYDYCYSRAFGSRVRSKDDWEFIIRGLKDYATGRCFAIVDQADSICGYFFERDNCILEIAFDSKVNCRGLLLNIAQFLQIDEVKFYIFPAHPMLSVDIGCDVTISQRECFYGGHILKITNNLSVIEKFEKSVMDKNKNLTIRFGDIVVSVNERGILLDTVLKKDWPEKFPWGTAPLKIPFSYELTKFLLGIESRYACYNDIKVMPFVISPIDEF